MNYSIFNKVYEENKKLDAMFENSFTDSKMHEKNKLELLVEIGELANETRFFKYWSNKKMNIDLVKGEFADCFMMALSFFDVLNISLDGEFKKTIDYDKTDIFAKLYELGILFYKSDSIEIIKEFFSTLITLGYIIGFTDEDIIDFTLAKIERNKERFEEGF